MTTLSRRDLEILECLDSSPSLTAIARELGVSQPLISARLADLERECGQPLIVRTTTGFSPRPAAFRLARSARRALLALDAADDSFAALASNNATPAERVQIAASLTVAENLLPAWLALMGSPHDISVTVTNSRRVEALVTAGEAEVGFIEGPYPPTELSAWTITDDDLVLICRAVDPPELPAGPISARALIELPLVIREEGSGTREVLAEACLREDVRLPARLPQVSSAAAILQAVRHGSLAVVPELTVRDQVAAGEFRAIETTLGLHRSLRMVTKSGARLSPVARRLARIVRADR
ncbi:hypothetical protein BSZ39_09165 [Bowdeniella nasicola]|uniref:HTH lysR-type domain-containing protein n=1 Tax=Bowdeniella nasicola TaxID=208480 RepID=A0A1Q5Q1A8_9ACTO|nr:LysR family transcriptional regulator [Bowdeniella nasicola]OKL53509.1 hypothetical protein BSZ39_09165 [Bowdeniella nasicola]